MKYNPNNDFSQARMILILTLLIMVFFGLAFGIQFDAKVFIGITLLLLFAGLGEILTRKCSKCGSKNTIYEHCAGKMVFICRHCANTRVD